MECNQNRGFWKRKKKKKKIGLQGRIHITKVIQKNWVLSWLFSIILMVFKPFCVGLPQ